MNAYTNFLVNNYGANVETEGTHIFINWTRTLNGKTYKCAAYTTTKSKNAKWEYWYDTDEKAQDAINRQKMNIARTEQYKAERKQTLAGKKEAAQAALEVGQILYTSWGYDQTNVDFYQVVKVSGKRAYVREIKQSMQPGSEMGLTATTVAPVADDFCNEETLVVGVSNYGTYSVDGHHASKYDGKPKYCSWGH